MENRVCFIGHRDIAVQGIEDRIRQAVINEIKNGATCFMVGSHGMFDKIVLNVCKNLKKIYNNINTEVVITSLAKINHKKDYDDRYDPYQDINVVMFDIEQEYFKRQISISNRKMVDSSDTLICYVDTRKSHSGAKSTLNYAKKKGLKIINLFNSNDDPTFNMTKQQLKEYFKSLSDKFDRLLKK